MFGLDFRVFTMWRRPFSQYGTRYFFPAPNMVSFCVFFVTLGMVCGLAIYERGAWMPRIIAVLRIHIIDAAPDLAIHSGSKFSLWCGPGSDFSLYCNSRSGCESPTTVLHASIWASTALRGSILSLHSSWVLFFFYADPDPAFNFYRDTGLDP